MLTYNDLEVKVMSYTEDPGKLCKLACDHTMVAEPEEGLEASVKLLKFLVTAEHTSVLEHCSITFRISGVSRSLLAQLTRHRMGSFTSQSQHYQDYTKAPTIVHPTMQYEANTNLAIMQAYKAYERLLALDFPRQEARQVLPNASSVNILWSVNARSLMGFLRQRLCDRNVFEMTNFANIIRIKALWWWPELFNLSGPPCDMDGACNQGHMGSQRCK